MGTAVPQNVTVVFGDIVDGTLAPSKAGPEPAGAVRRHCRDLLLREIAEAGGTHIGHPGAGAMAAFPTASAALESAVAMQRSVDGDNRARGGSLGLGIGLSGGEVVLDRDGDPSDPVVEAVLLCGRASSGKILATRVVKDTAGRRTRYPYRFVGHVELEGLPELVEVFEVGWEPSPTGVHA